LENQENKFEAVRKKLIGLRQDLIRESKAEIVQSLDGGAKYNGVSDDGDLADVAIRDALQAATLTRHQAALKAIEEAIRRIDKGDYGICEDCDEDIPVGRLNAMPFALRCIECQEKLEMTSSRRQEINMHSSFFPDEERED
jgi:DnaK suppressor protein